MPVNPSGRGVAAEAWVNRHENAHTVDGGELLSERLYRLRARTAVQQQERLAGADVGDGDLDRLFPGYCHLMGGGRHLFSSFESSPGPIHAKSVAGSVA